MKCEACLGMMDQLIEGDLDDSLSRDVSAHIAMCGTCSQVFANLRYERELYGKYLLDVEPPADLWANLRLELEKEKVIRAPQPPRKVQGWLAIAPGGWRVSPQMAMALVLITIGLAIGIIVWRTTADRSRHRAQNPEMGLQPSPEVNRADAHPDSDNTDRRPAANDNDEKILGSSPKTSDRARDRRVNSVSRAGSRVIERIAAVQTADQAARSAEQEYLSAIQILSRDIERRRAVISPGLLSPLETALAEIDRNIAATRRAAREQPGDPVAVQYLAIAYEKKIELLRDVATR